MFSVSEIFVVILVSCLVGFLLGGLAGSYFLRRRYDIEEDDLGYLEKIMNDEKVSKNEMCS